MTADMNYDVERQARDQLPLQETAQDVVANENEDLVDFDGPDDPKNWTARSKILNPTS